MTDTTTSPETGLPITSYLQGITAFSANYVPMEQDYDLYFGDSFEHLGTRVYVCTGRCADYNFETLWSTSPVHRHSYKIVIDEEYVRPWYQYAKEVRGMSFCVPWAGRSGTAELELQSCLLPLRMVHLSLGVKSATTGTNKDPRLVLLREQVRDGSTYASPFSAYQDRGSLATGAAGWYLWAVSKELGVQFHDYNKRGWGLPYSGVVLHHSLLSRYSREALVDMLSPVHEYVMGWDQADEETLTKELKEKILKYSQEKEFIPEVQDYTNRSLYSSIESEGVQYKPQDKSQEAA